MVLINGRKFACDACIRGHRASNCSHTGRQLQQVRPKGRPSSQCDTCKMKRMHGSFHGKCQCNAPGLGSTRRPSDSSSGGSTSSRESDGRRGFGESFTWSMGESSRGRHSLESLMNPCQCKTTGICTCCRTGTNVRDAGTDILAQGGVGGEELCCDGDKCCSEDTLPVPSCSTAPASRTQGASCCSGGVKGKQTRTEYTPATPVLASQPGISRRSATTSPSCHCGPNCSCPGCLDESEASRLSRAKMGESEVCPEKCLTCSGCAFGLTRPSGIEAIDEWIERDKRERGVSSSDESAASNGEAPHKRAKKAVIKCCQTKRTAPSVESPPIQSSQGLAAAPSLPPFPNAASFYSSHFLDTDRRAYFAEQLQESHAVLPSTISPAHIELQHPNDYGKRMLGESDEEWQIRHGFYYLTPEAIQIFDSARKFKEERKLLEEEDERRRLEGSVTPSDSSLSSLSPVLAQEVHDLRRKALMARKNSSTTQTPITSV